MPKGLSEAEIGAAIAASGAQDGQDMGKLIAALTAEYSGRIDFGKALPRVKAGLGLSRQLSKL